jgi:hypothetical protein
MLRNPSAAQPTFTAPDVDTDDSEVDAADTDDSEVLTFSLTVTDSKGLADPTPDSVTITVNDEDERPDDVTAAPQGDGGNDATDVEPTSFNPQTVTSTPQLTFVQSGGGTTASNSDVAASSDGDDVLHCMGTRGRHHVQGRPWMCRCYKWM